MPGINSAISVLATFFRSNRTALIFSFLYFVPAIIWVVLSDGWVFTPDTLAIATKYRKLDEIKDTGLVLATGIMLFFIIRVSGKKLRDTKTYYQNLFYLHPNPMWIYDKSTLQFLDVNNAAILHYGYSRKEFLSMTAKDIRPAESLKEMTEFVSEMKPGIEYSHIWQHKKKNGELIMIEATANGVEFQNKPCWLISVIDITERFIKDEQIKKLSLVAENATNSMIILDKDGQIEWINSPFTALTGYTLQEVKGKKPQDFLHGPDTDQQTRAEILKCLQQGKPFTGEILNYHKNGTKFWLRLTVSPVIRNNVVENFVTIQTDITKIKWQNSYLRDIAFIASHKFRKPLANIIGLVNELEHGQGNSQQELQYLKQSAEELDAEIRNIVEKTAFLEDIKDDERPA